MERVSVGPTRTIIRYGHCMALGTMALHELHIALWRAAAAFHKEYLGNC